MITSQRIAELRDLITKEQELSKSKAQYEKQGLVYAGSMPHAKARLELKNAAMLELPALLDELEKLQETLLKLRELNREHYECEDYWYSCPKSGKCCNEQLVDDICLCGKDKMDDIINAALEGW